MFFLKMGLLSHQRFSLNLETAPERCIGGFGKHWKPLAAENITASLFSWFWFWFWFCWGRNMSCCDGVTEKHWAPKEHSNGSSMQLVPQLCSQQLGVWEGGRRCSTALLDAWSSSDVGFSPRLQHLQLESDFVRIFIRSLSDDGWRDRTLAMALRLHRRSWSCRRSRWR